MSTPAHQNQAIGGPRVVTFGCRLNIAESEVMRQNGQAAGVGADTIVVNTCAVTAEAERQARQAIRRLRRENPDAEIIATGCAAQIAPDRYADMPEVSRVLGNVEKLKAESFLPGPDVAPKVHVSDIMTVQETAAHMVEGFEAKVRAFVQIQQGCDHRCTFCIIPFGRGNNRSVPVGALVEQVRALVGNGYREVVLTGVDITGYGGDLPGQPPLGQLVRRLLSHVPELGRLRLSSIDPAEVDDDLITMIADEPRLMPHFHISVQAGDDMILKRMKRRHLRADVLSFVEQVRGVRPDAVFGADIIAGFPTETDEMFENSVRLIDEANLTHLHVFPYSVREGTPAAKMPQVDRSVVKMRAARLRASGELSMGRYLRSRIGSQAQVLIEKPGRGQAETYVPVTVPDAAGGVGDVIAVRVTGVADGALKGVPA